MAQRKSVESIYSSAAHYWVGDGFPVRNAFPSNPLRAAVSPFLMLDYAGPMYFEPATSRRGVGEHPHRGFETVTLLYQGELEHRDSAGHVGKIGPNDVQWMTAGSGIVHEELHSAAFTQQGGWLQLVQLWVNLPRMHKMTAPNYQELPNAVIPIVSLAEGAGSLRVIAGEFCGVHGPALTYSPIELFDVRLGRESSCVIVWPAGHSASLFVLDGEIVVPGSTRSAKDGDLMLFSPRGTEVEIIAKSETLLLILGGEIIDEPIAAQGPFVMNTREELAQAVRDFQSGKMGRLSPIW